MPATLSGVKSHGVTAHSVHKGSLRAIRRARACRLVCIAVFVLLSMPRARLVVAGVPLYHLDFLALLSFWACLRAKMLGLGVINAPWIGAFMLIAAISQVQHVLLGGDTAGSLYIYIRYVLAVLLHASVTAVCRTEGGVRALLTALSLGAGVTGFLSLGSSVPGLRTAASILLSNPYLNPTQDKIATILGGAEAARGISLVGTSTLTAAFLAATWPVSLVLARSRQGRSHGSASWLLTMTILFGALATYSRGAVLAVVASLLVMTIAGARREMKRAVGALIALAIVVGVVGVNSEDLLVNRLVDRTQVLVTAIEEGQIVTRNEGERAASWFEPFSAISKDPTLLVVGYGNTRGHSEGVSRQVFSRHSGLASGIFYFGLVAALMFHWGVIRAGWRSLRIARQALDSNRGFAAGGAGSVAAILVWLLVGHAGISTPRGFAFILVLLALISTQGFCGSGGRNRSV